MKKEIHLKKGGRSRARLGHPWVYRSEIADLKGDPQPGDIVEVVDQGRRLGTGYFNPASEISLRILSRKPCVIDVAFFQFKLQKALDYRKRFTAGAGAYRLVAGEADGLPGLVIDNYAGVLVLQFLTLGMEKQRAFVLAALEAVMPEAKGIYEKSDSGSRTLEGLEPKVGWLSQECGAEIIVEEAGVRFTLRLDGGHKTGLYLDQRENHEFLQNLKIKGTCLDAFCYEGGFALHLARGGAKEVLGIDSQADAVARAEENRKLNGLSETQVRFETGNVFDRLKEFETSGRRFDLVVLDPPSFVKKKAALEGALAGYKEIVLRSMKILNEGGLLAVFSCSFHVSDDLLMQVSLSAAHDVRKTLKVLRFFKQSADHPIDPVIPETYYLKGFLFEVSSL